MEEKNIWICRQRLNSIPLSNALKPISCKKREKQRKEKIADENSVLYFWLYFSFGYLLLAQIAFAKKMVFLSENSRLLVYNTVYLGESEVYCETGTLRGVVLKQSIRSEVVMS